MRRRAISARSPRACSAITSGLFKLTGLLLTVSVVGAVVLARRPRTLEEAADVAEGTGSPV